MPEISTGHRHHFGEAMSKYTAEGIREFRKGNRAYHLKDVLEAFEDLLGEREAAKAGVTDGWPEYVMLRDTGLYDDAGGLGQRIYTTAGSGYKKRKYILEAVAPMLASIQPPDMVCEQHPWSEWPHDDCAGPGMPGTAQYEALVYLAKLASARVPDELKSAPASPLHPLWGDGYLRGWNACRAVMLAAAPKPDVEERHHWLCCGALKSDHSDKPRVMPDCFDPEKHVWAVSPKPETEE